MLDRDYVMSVVDRYSRLRREDVSICSLGSHSALEIMDGAKDEGFRTVVVCQKGRELPYKRFRRLADEVIVLDSFRDMLNREVQARLLEMNSIIVPHRALTAYLGYDAVEHELMLPIFGNRSMLRVEDRQYERNQYYLLARAGIRHPKIIRDARDIDRPVMVKVQEARRRLERAFFIASSYEDYMRKAESRIEKGLITREDLANATIEEFIIGTYFNLNYFYSPLSDEVEFLGIERRLQTNLHDFTGIPARQQLEIMDELDVAIQNIEIGHTPASIRESMLERVFEIGDRFASVAKQEYPPGMIGVFSLQSIVTSDLDVIVYDVSPRVPGNPILATTSPYTKYMYGEVFGVGRRIAMEIRRAMDMGRLHSILT
ncbi:MAG: formate--phosphoribosylaminoimidazolecarboxamide ligase family protein [Candidatus Nitrosocaldus sp.]|nr:formate--phosphoribosylaminoimidazolecarboxamide ligase family protein [Candidatus Nitrosocaldus sp.]MDW8275018.1 formate--phosphoribosylaminoimidazolecarboxamide ligase family protein [Candidatus Nitrosocaldus sp.]